MASRATILQCFGVILGAGISAPKTWDDPATGAQSRDLCLELWDLCFAAVDDVTLRVAVTSYINGRDGRFWPIPGQITALLDRARVATGTGPPPLLDPDAAWGLVDRAVRTHGSYRPPNRPHDGHGPSWVLHEDPGQCAPLDAAVAAVGGWQTLCQRETDDRAIPAAFRRAYEAAVTREREEAPTRALLDAIQRRSVRMIGGGR